MREKNDSKTLPLAGLVGCDKCRCTGSHSQKQLCSVFRCLLIFCLTLNFVSKVPWVNEASSPGLVPQPSRMYCHLLHIHRCRGAHLFSLSWPAVHLGEGRSGLETHALSTLGCWHHGSFRMRDWADLWTPFFEIPT